MNNKIIDQSFYIKPKGIKEKVTAGGLVVRKTQDKLLIALIHEGRVSKLAIPKGTVEKGETLEQTARREIGEEAGIHDLTLVTYLGKLERLTFNKRTWSIQHLFLFTTTTEKAIPTEKERYYSTDWYSIDELPEIFWPDQRQFIEDNREKIKQLV